jgi:prophage regulatory protein
VVWDLGEVEAWVAERRRSTESASTRRAPHPDVRKRRSRPVKAPGQPPALASTAGREPGDVFVPPPKRR